MVQDQKGQSEEELEDNNKITKGIFLMIRNKIN